MCVLVSTSQLQDGRRKRENKRCEADPSVLPDQLNSEIMKKRVINAAITLGIYTRGINQDTVVQDCVEALCQLNDNDIHDAFRYKKKKARQFNASELAETYVSSDTHEYQVVNINTGELLTDIIP